MADEKKDEHEVLEDLEPKKDPKGGIEMPQPVVDFTPGPRRRKPGSVSEPE